MRRWKIGIRPQLIILVCFSSLFSLLILALVTTVYFSNSLSNLRAERLEVIAELKATQVKQALQYTYYQIYWLTNRDSINSALSSYRAGNYSQAVFAEAQTTLDQLLTSSELFAGARLYNLDLDVVANSYNNLTAITQPTMDALYPFAKNASVPVQLQSVTPSSPAYYTGPLSNNSDVYSTYFMGITLPVFANTSIIFPEPTLAGYLTVIASADNLRSAINDTTSLNTNSTKGDSDDYKVIAVRPTYSSATYSSSSSKAGNITLIDGFDPVFPVDLQSFYSIHYPITASSAVKEAFSKAFGSATNVRNIEHKKVAIGYNQIELNPTNTWAIIIEQSHSKFYAPVHRLINIIVGVVIGTGVFMCLVTFPLAVFFIRPITKLKAATESIAKSKKRYLQNNHSSSSAVSHGSSPSILESSGGYEIFTKRARGGKDENSGLNKRNSVNSVYTGTTVSAHSTAIRLPGKIPNSKKLFKDELTELTEAFNIMTDELDKQYAHLEDRVKLRTKELEASKIEAEAANEAKTVFIANISHELRTPLNGILGMTAIAMDESDHTRIHDSLELIHRSGELLLHILTELLTYSKNTLNRSKLEKSNFQILEVVDQVKSIFTKLALDQRVNFKILIKPNVIRKLVLHGDSNRIIQIVMNLVSNSLKFTPVDGSVGVTFKLLGEYDYQKSAGENFAKVNILPKYNKKESPSSSNGDSTLLNKSNISEIKPISKKKVDTDLDNDNISVVTLSTAEYENNIFESQFNHMKPLPKTPSGASSVHSIGSIRKHDTSSILSRKSVEVAKNSDSSTSSVLNEKITDSSSDGKENGLLPPHSEVAELHNSSVANTTVGTFYDNAKRNSVVSNLGTNEMVKNSKTYRIRNMYKPKTWAIQIEVTDTGPGIEPALQEKVFEPFIQGDQTLSRSYGGTGLGLSICRQLATMMKGTLTLKSSVGQGSTFTFTVPLPQTGEIVVLDEDMDEFCNDEYNPNARMNRKVVFENTEISENETPEDKMDSSFETPEVKIIESGDESPKSNIRSRDIKSGDDLISEHSHTSEEKRKHNFKIEIPSRTTLLEKPQLIARSSTGTANSNNGSERNDSLHNLLDDLSDLHILVAEDNLVNQEVIKRMLHLEGFHNVTMACNGAEAVELVKESIGNLHPYDVILMDVQMPKIDGLLATKMIRNNLNYDRPIIALTAFADESNVKECLNSGMSGFLAKPIRRANLRKTIVKFSPVLLSEVVTTPQTFNGDEKRLQ
ncbi:histidine kinase osmosensor osmolarity two-component system protein SLN1 [Suhomyces tanzawaensis NRRL Y-17324]|uniref:histidine kinase n=1 Tax=Suhomyces tanzawaensis NRRL Y-17324 TaxID=984487 RepID=A0A1E4SF89_9ASCO|nr:histidine kinase osmosensor osmolarity two-component system protein SLN1 [Suhomyces tanzawaensis NRRL Y-17324]ODV78187.1 histidine kinase osmosensor osmolarity two-component system protein SLN1 [Suhomyces tanzawaensis NRRL Y-17324]